VPSLPRRLANLVRLEHSLFALPYAIVGALLAADGLPPIIELLWIGVAMVAAQTLAMGLNRLIDAEVDARNPRTAKREIPAGLVSKGQVVGLCVVSLAVLLVACWNLAIAPVIGPDGWLHVRHVPRLGAQHARRRGRVHCAGTHLMVVRLPNQATALRPKAVQRHHHFLKSQAG